MPCPRQRPAALGIAGVVAASIGNYLAAFDASAVSVILPTLTSQLGVSPRVGQWFLDGYTIPFCVFFMVSGAVGDRIGAAKVYRAALVGFLVASLLCAAADDATTLIAARALQGASASFALPMTLAILAKGIDDPRRRATMIGAWGVVGGFGIASAPVLGGVIAHYAGWRWLFLVNVPICVAALVMIRAFADAPSNSPRRVDWPSQLLLATGLTATAGTLIEGGGRGWTDPWILGMAATAVASFAALAVVAGRGPRRLVPAELASNPSYLLVLSAGACYQFASYGSLLVLSLYLRSSRGLAADQAGYVMLVCCVAWLMGNIAAVWVAPDLRRGAIRAMGAAGALGALGSAALSTVTDDLFLVIAPTALIGFASGVLAPSLSAEAMHASPPEASGAAAGLFNTSRQSGMVVAVAVLGSLAWGARLPAPMLAIAIAFASMASAAALAGRLEGRLGSNKSPALAGASKIPQRETL